MPKKPKPFASEVDLCKALGLKIECSDEQAPPVATKKSKV